MRNECAIVALDHAQNLRIPPHFGLRYLPVGMAARLCAVFSVSAHRQRRARKMTRDVRERIPLLVYSDSKRLLTFVKLLDNVIELDEGGFRTAGVHRDDVSGISRHLPPPAQGEPPPYAYCVRLLTTSTALCTIRIGGWSDGTPARSCIVARGTLDRGTYYDKLAHAPYGLDRRMCVVMELVTCAGLGIYPYDDSRARCAGGRIKSLR